MAALAVSFCTPAMAQSSNQLGNFSPGHSGGKKTISATTASSSVALDAASVGEPSLMIVSAGPSEAYCRWDGSAATTSDVPILSGTVQVFSKGVSGSVACITASGTATIEVYTGFGR